MTSALSFPDPQPQQRANWLGRYLAVERKFDDRLRNVLLDALSGVDEAFGNLNDNFSSQVRKQQLALSSKAIRRTIHDIFKADGNLVREYRQDAAVAAVESQLYDERGILSRLFPETIQRRQYADSLRQSARRNVESVITRVLETERPLSERVYRSEALANHQVSQAINRALARGDSAKNLADSVKHLINPDTPGGVSYAAKRLGRTEINNAFHAQSIHDAAETPWIQTMAWNLSKTHEVPDECTDYAQIKYFDIENVPDKPHPNCRCYVTPEQPDYQTFEDDLVQGKYDDHLDKILDESVEPQDITAQESKPRSTKLQVEIDKAGPGKEIYPWSGMSSAQRKELQEYNLSLQAKAAAAEVVPKVEGVSKKKIRDKIIPKSIAEAENSAQVGNWLKDNYDGLEVSGFDYEAVDPRSAKEIGQAFVDNQARYKTNLKSLKIMEIPPTVNGIPSAETFYSAKTKTSEIRFNLADVAEYDKFKEGQKALIESGYFSERRGGERPWRSTFTHEFGHVLDFSSGARTSMEANPKGDLAWLAQGSKAKDRKVTGILYEHYESVVGKTLDFTDPKVIAKYDDWFVDNIPSGYSWHPMDKTGNREIYPEELVAEAFSNAVESQEVSPVSRGLTRKLLQNLREYDQQGRLKVPISKRVK